eukprot:TRINITY_DN25395_c0_g1_i1.p1 TRINITY_DN25395_c0_g1~~TRINITY_DN25395_c0_g1_i1.p1  ORF type:complete len:107 (+),score=5.96 TRINITY_DN25395_c0_g1_i1:73-393(+)
MAPHNIREITKRTQVLDVLHQNDTRRRHLPRNRKPTKRLHSPKPTHTRKLEDQTIGSTRQTDIACKYEDPSRPCHNPAQLNIIQSTLAYMPTQGLPRRSPILVLPT